MLPIIAELFESAVAKQGLRPALGAGAKALGRGAKTIGKGIGKIASHTGSSRDKVANER